MNRLFKHCVWLALCWLGLNCGALAQQTAWQGEVSWSGGVGFGETKVRVGRAVTPGGALQLDNDPQRLQIGTPSEGAAPIMRALRLADGRAIVYKLLVKPLEGGARFEVTLQAHEPTPAQSESWKINPARVERGFLSKYTQPLIISDGDTLALDVLVDPRTNAKITDLYLISTGSPITRRAPEKVKAEARELTLDDLSLSVTGYQVRRNGTTVYSNGGGASARFIFLDVPAVGRVWFTVTTPPPGSGFERAAVVNDKQLIFTIGDAQYEWNSKERILPAEGSFYVWMLHDANYSTPSLKMPPEMLKEVGEKWGRHGGLDRWRLGKEDEE